jgi:myo-inositol-1-phosphate synthase
MADRRVGLWLVGAFGGVGTTTAIGLAALAKGRVPPIGLVTALPQFSAVPFDPPGAFTVGGHDVRAGSFEASAAELHGRSNVFPESLLAAVTDELTAWSRNVQPGIVFRPDAATARLADRPDVRQVAAPRAAVEHVRADLHGFQSVHRLDQVVVVNCASTEPPVEASEGLQDPQKFDHLLDRADAPTPASALYAVAALSAGFPYVNLTPSLGASFPAAEAIAKDKGVPHLGQDAKTGETLLKSVLAPLFAKRHLKVLSWVGHNILGNRDGRVLADPHNKASKVKSKDALLAELLGYRPQSLVTIEYVESLDDWKTAWDHVHFEGFLGTKMTLQFTWQGCDSLLAAPLVIDLARLALFAQRKGEAGTVPAAACFFKSPLGAAEHDFGKQFALLEHYLTGR